MFLKMNKRTNSKSSLHVNCNEHIQTDSGLMQSPTYDSGLVLSLVHFLKFGILASKSILKLDSPQIKDFSVSVKCNFLFLLRKQLSEMCIVNAFPPALISGPLYMIIISTWRVILNHKNNVLGNI